MDICLVSIDNAIQIRPSSIHGMLWLQTHFEDAHWSALASSQVQIPLEDAIEMSADIQAAGLSLNHIPALTISSGL